MESFNKKLHDPDGVESFKMENISKLSELYGLDMSIVSRIDKGFQSENYILTDGSEKYFFKTYNASCSKERLIEIHQVKKFFFDRGMPVILPVPTKENKTYFESSGNFCSLFPFADEKQFEVGQLTETAVISLGKTHGRMHLAGRNADIHFKNEKYRPWNSSEVLQKIGLMERMINKKTHTTDFDMLALDDLKIKKELISDNSVTFEDIGLPADHLVHGDYLYQNVFFDDNDSVSHIFDFEKTNYYPRSYELVRSMMLSCLTGDFSQEEISKAKKYLEAYKKTYPIAEEEIKRGLKLYYLITIHSIRLENEHYLKNNSRIDSHLFPHFNRIKYMAENFESLEKLVIA